MTLTPERVVSKWSADPPVDAETLKTWQADLETIVPRSDRVPWLALVWQPGWPYEPVQRFELYEMTAQLDWVPDGVLDALRGPNPRTVGVWHTGTDGIERWISDSLVSRVQWELFRATGCYGSRWWIIQGDNGGHRLRLGREEREVLKQLGQGAPEWPAPGALPYAPYDGRVREQVLRADRLRQWRHALAWDDRSARKHDAAKFVGQHRDALQREYNALLLRWLDDQIEGAVSEVSKRELAAAFADAPAMDRTQGAEREALEADILES